MRKLVLPLMIGTSLLATAQHALAMHDRDDDDKLTVAVFGDAPYGTSNSDTAEFDATPAFINSINADPDVSLVMHAGDIHSGKQYCTEAYDRSIYNLWSAFQDPLVYTPGDNEWTDCHKTKEGGNVFVDGSPVDYANGDPVANLDLIRSIFFATPGYTIGGYMAVHSQANDNDYKYPSDAKYVENVRWDMKVGHREVTFVTVNMPGGSNNDSDIWYGASTTSAAQAQEIEERTGADLRWLDKAFRHARRDEVMAMVIMLQADMWDLDGKDPSHIAGYKQFIDRIAALSKAFRKPVLLINGDSHTFRSDNPLKQGSPCVIEPSSGAAAVACSADNTTPADPYLSQPWGYDVPNFHRIVVHGSKFPLEWLKLTIDPRAHGHHNAGTDSFGPFSWQRMSQQ